MTNVGRVLAMGGLVVAGLAACSSESLMGGSPAGQPGIATKTGAGGATVDGGATSPLCTGVAPASPQLTGVANTVAVPSGGYSYAAPELTLPTITPVYSADGFWQSLAVVASPGAGTDQGGNWLGVGVPLMGCVDASAYTGVRFTITGALSFVAVPTEQAFVSNGGACIDPSCYSPASAPFGVGTTTVRFVDLNGGNPPGPVDPSRLLDIQWQMSVPIDGVTAPCMASFTITDVSFVTD
jgi:hypothetical protein